MLSVKSKFQCFFLQKKMRSRIPGSASKDNAAILAASNNHSLVSIDIVGMDFANQEEQVNIEKEEAEDSN